uniref:Ffamide 1 n=1 Tax=Deroceras reticulatum TaxID=145610 RepID=A0A1X9WED5_DERRE|nr:ffamide 1 [Deroceras reticulatum]
MKLVSILVAMAAFMLVVAMEPKSRIAERDVKSLLSQQPLLFGRRGLRPGMNSLFFGKKSAVSSSQSTQELRQACMNYLSTLDTVSDMDGF